MPDSGARFFLPGDSELNAGQHRQDTYLAALQTSWEGFTTRQQEAETTWVEDLSAYLADMATRRVEHVQEWLTVNMARFMADTSEFDTIRRSFEAMTVSLRVGVQLCKMSCAQCQLLCLLTRHHDGHHACRTNHRCAHACSFTNEHGGDSEKCGLP